MSERVERIDDSVIVYDDALIGQMDEGMFAAGEQTGGDPAANGVAGRGKTHFVSIQGRECVLRHYYRGGMIRRLSEDSFIWNGEDRTRSFSEWRLLAELRARSLPVPLPVAARYVRRGMFYTADLITERLSGVQSLAARLRSGPLPDGTWRAVGAMLARFHDQRVNHADLNAHNIQLDGSDGVYLLDFDRGRIMPADGAWPQRNLLRLHRSLDKIRRRNGAHFRQHDWQSLLNGYGS